MKPFEITILGCSSATPTVDRHPSAQILNIKDHLILIDCGEATQNQLLHYKIKHSRIRHIFISHLHGDHYLGLNGLLATINFQGREDELHVYGPEPLEQLIYDHFRFSGTVVRFPLFFHVTSDLQPFVLVENEVFRVTSIPLLHRIPTTGFLFEEMVPQRRINAAACERYKIPFTYYADLRDGADYITSEGTVIYNDELTTDPKKPRTYAYISDTIYLPGLPEKIQDVDLLYHESTFLHELVDRATETFHTTALQAGSIARQANAGMLILGHFSARYRDLTPLLFEAQREFTNSVLAIEGEKYTVD